MADNRNVTGGNILIRICRWLHSLHILDFENLFNDFKWENNE